MNKLSDLVVEILAQRDKIQNKDKQSFYFRKGIASHKSNLKNLEVRFRYYKRLINTNTIEVLRLELLLEEIKLQELMENKRTPSFSRSFLQSKISSKINTLNMCIEAKEKYSKIKSIDEYLKSEAELLQFFEE